MSDEQFDHKVFEAIAAMPEPFSEKITEINFIIEDMPTMMQRSKLELRDCDALFGLYEGVPLTKRHGMIYTKVPDTITIFRHPMIEMHSDIDHLIRQIYETVWHEIGHYFGFDHDRIAKIKQRHRLQD